MTALERTASPSTGTSVLAVRRTEVERLRIVEDYGSYCARRADEQAEEAMADLAEPAVDYELVLLCAECRGSGRREIQTGSYWADYVVEGCCFCDGSGATARYPIGDGVGLP